MYLAVFIEAFRPDTQRWQARGIWKMGPKGYYMPQPVYINQGDAARTTLLGLLHPELSAYRAHGVPELPLITEPPENLSLEVGDFYTRHQGVCRLSWALLSEVQEYPWDTPCEQVFHLTEEGAEWFDHVGVPRDEDLEAPLSHRPEVRRQTLTPEELWGDVWLRRTLPKLQLCDSDNRVIFLILDQYTVR